eukprot:gene4898-6859_t
MKLDVNCMRYLSKDDFRVLTAVEMTMRNHDTATVDLISSVAQLRSGGTNKILSTLLRYKLVAHSNQEYDGYRVSYLGYDILALRTLLARGVVMSVGNQIGVGKESDIFEAMDESGNEIVIKLHRLGRTSFRAVRNSRDYTQGKNKCSWLFMSRLAATKEFAFMKALYSHGFPTPIPIDQNRHIVVMSRINGCPLSQLKAGKLINTEEIFIQCYTILMRLAKCGLIHCDFNEFNLMIDESGKDITLIDFPQMISTSHLNASEFFKRDINCLIKFFSMKMHFIPSDDYIVSLESITPAEVQITNDNMIKSDENDDNNNINNNNNQDDLLFEHFHNFNNDNNDELTFQNDIIANDDELEDDNEDDEASNDDGLDVKVDKNDLKLLDFDESVEIAAQILGRNNRKAGFQKDNNSKQSRNATKKRSKYGKIVKADKFDV